MERIKGNRKGKCSLASNIFSALILGFLATVIVFLVTRDFSPEVGFLGRIVEILTLLGKDRQFSETFLIMFTIETFLYFLIVRSSC